MKMGLALALVAIVWAVIAPEYTHYGEEKAIA